MNDDQKIWARQQRLALLNWLTSHRGRKPKEDEETFMVVPNRKEIRAHGLNRNARNAHMSRLGTRYKLTPASLYTHIILPMPKGDGTVMKLRLPIDAVKRIDSNAQ